jgi:hypothetical protein
MGRGVRHGTKCELCGVPIDWPRDYRAPRLCKLHKPLGGLSQPDEQIAAERDVKRWREPPAPKRSRRRTAYRRG